jgi:hypothetical protein
MTDTSNDALPVFNSTGQMQGNLTSSQGQPPAAAPPAQPPMPDFLQKEAQGMEGVQKADDAAMQQRSAAMLKPMSALSSINASPMPQMGQQQKIPPAPDAKDYHKHALAFASAMAVLGAVAGRFTRAPGGAALSAFAGAMDGWKSGNLEKYETAAKQWEQNTKATLDNNRQVMDQYKLALENRKMNIDEQMSQIQLIAAQYHDQIMYDAAAAKNYTLVAQVYEKQWEYTNGPKGVEAAAAPLMADRRKQDEQNKLTAAKWGSLEGQIELDSLKPDGTPKYDTAFKAKVKQTVEMYGGSEGKGSRKGAAGGLQGDLLTRRRAEREASGLPPETTDQEVAFLQKMKPPRSASAISLKQKMDEAEAQGTPMNSQQIQKFIATQAGMSAEERAFGTTVGNLKTIIHTAYSAIPRAEELSSIVPRGGFVPINKLMQMGEKNITDPNLKKFLVANLNVAELWAKAMNVRGVMRESDRDLALQNLYTADTPQNYRAALSELKVFLEREQTAVKEARDDMPLGSLTGAGKGAAPAAGGDEWGDLKVH